MHNAGSTPTLTNCWFSRNTSNFDGGGMYNLSSNPLVTNCIFWGNTAPSAAQINGATASVSYSCVQGGYEGAGNLSDDPMCVDADGPDDIPGTEDDNLRLLPGSLCIDAGDPDFVPDPGETDLDGHARVLCDRVDMGAYEFGIGDYDCDRNVDLTDFASWIACMTGPDGGPYDAGCEAFDFEFDGYVTLRDFAGFQKEFVGSEP